MHLAFRALAQFQIKHSALPMPGNSDHAEELFAIVQTLNSQAGNGSLKVGSVS